VEMVMMRSLLHSLQEDLTETLEQGSLTRRGLRHTPSYINHTIPTTFVCLIIRHSFNLLTDCEDMGYTYEVKGPPQTTMSKGP
jgi:hypothetical protein